MGCTLAAIVAPVIAVAVVVYLLYGVVLNVAIWVLYCSRGIRVLFVYSNSPIWQEYLEERVIPRLPENAIVLNWSERRNWKRFSLSVRAFHHFGGDREFNPLAVIFRPFGRTRIIRFWRAFKDYSRGNEDPLKRVEAELLDAVGPQGERD